MVVSEPCVLYLALFVSFVRTLWSFYPASKGLCPLHDEMWCNPICSMHGNGIYMYMRQWAKSCPCVSWLIIGFITFEYVWNKLVFLVWIISWQMVYRMQILWNISLINLFVMVLVKEDIESNITGWWFQPPWKICSSDWIIIPTMGKNKTCSKPPTR